MKISWVKYYWLLENGVDVGLGGMYMGIGIEIASQNTPQNIMLSVRMGIGVDVELENTPHVLPLNAPQRSPLEGR